MKQLVLKITLVYFVMQWGYSQKSINTTVDTNEVKIGSQINLKLKIKVDTNTVVFFPEQKVFGLLEVLESYPVDTLKEGKKHTLIKKYGLTQFDSGKYLLPKLPVLINKKTYYSDSLSLYFQPVTVDTLKQKMYDIKTVIEAEKPPLPWYIKLLAVFILIAFILAIYYWQKNKKPKLKKAIILEEIISPIEKAEKQLQQLEKKALIEKGEIKNYYSELTEIVRTYIEEVLEIPAMESTTDELIEAFDIESKRKKLRLQPETLQNLEKVLKNADLVKFAKYNPLQFEIEEDNKKIKNTIVTIHKSIPEKVEEEDFSIADEIARKKALADKKRKQNIQAVLGILVFIITCVAVFIIVTRGVNFFRENYLGSQSKELLEGRWIRSEYGNPSISLETPQVLKRIKTTNFLLFDGNLIKDIQEFELGSFKDLFHIKVTSATFKDTVKTTIDEALNNELKKMELAGAQNMFVSLGEYQLPDGVKGKKASGTFTLFDENKEKVLMQYLVILLMSNNGLQEIQLINKENDAAAKEIMKKVEESIEIGKPL